MEYGYRLIDSLLCNSVQSKQELHQTKRALERSEKLSQEALDGLRFQIAKEIVFLTRAQEAADSDRPEDFLPVFMHEAVGYVGRSVQYG